jgi:hypothetical protein
LHHVTLGSCSGLASRGSEALYVHDHAGDLGHSGIPDVLLHQRKTGAAGSGHGFESANSGADDGGHAGDLVLHLDEFSTNLGKFAGKYLGHFSGGGDGVTCVETASGSDCPQTDDFITLHKPDSQENLLIQFPDHESQVGAVGVAKMTGSALLGGDDAGDVLVCVHCQHFGWAEIHTDMATFAPLGVYDHLTPWSLFGRHSGSDSCFRLGNGFGHEVPLSNKNGLDDRYREVDFIQSAPEL